MDNAIAAGRLNVAGSDPVYDAGICPEHQPTAHKRLLDVSSLLFPLWIVDVNELQNDNPNNPHTSITVAYVGNEQYDQNGSNPSRRSGRS